MEYNTGLLEMLDNDPRAYGAIWTEHKQINPDTRIELVQSHMITLAIMEELTAPAPVRMNKSGLRAALWRALGGLFHAGLYERGRFDFYGALPPIKEETVQLRHFGWDYGHEQKQIGIGYHAVRDTLYVRKF